MGQPIRADYKQQFLLPPCLEDWVPADHPARFIREFVDAMDLKALGFQPREGEEGRSPYAADLLLKVWVYGYFARVYSTRQLERACREHMSLVWLTGNNPPDHNTLWRFFDENRAAFRRVFKQGVRIAAKAGMVGMALHAVDGTKVAAQVSGRTAWHQEDMERLLASLDKAVEEIERQVETRQQEETGDYRLPDELADKQRLRRRIEEGLAEMRREGTEHLHPEDPQARMMHSDGRTQFAYNGQVVVDGDSGLIVAQEVVNDASDAHQLVPMLDAARETLGAVADDTAADGGYVSGEQIAAARRKGYGILLPMKDATATGDYHASRFTHDSARDVVICPCGEALPYERTKPGRRGQYDVRVYRCKSFRVCPARHACTRDPRGRMIEIGPHYAAVRRQLDKQRDAANREKLKKRGGIVERVFAGIKTQMGFRRFTVNGREGVRAQWALLCIVHNLRTLRRSGFRWEPTAA